MASGSAELKRFALGSIGERPAQPVYGLCRSAAGSGGFECLHHGHYLIAVTAAAGGLVWADTIARFRLGTDAADRVFAEILSTLSFLCMPKRQLACVTNCAAGLTGKSWLHRCAHLRLTDGVYICLAFHKRTLEGPDMLVRRAGLADRMSARRHQSSIRLPVDVARSKARKIINRSAPRTCFRN